MRIEGYRVRLSVEHMELMRVPRRFWEASVAQIEPETREIVSKYLEQLDRMLDMGAGMILWGDNGRGKTAAAVCVAKDARRRSASVLMVTAAEYVNAVLSRSKDDDDELLIERARTVDFLLLDDLGKENRTRFSEVAFENLIRARTADRLTTWITMNDFDWLKANYKQSFVEVLKEACVPYRMEGPNLRDQEAGNLRDRLMAKVG